MVDKREFTLWSLRSYLRPHRRALIGAAATMSLRATVLLLLPWPLKFIIDSVLFRHPLPHWMIGWLPDPALQRFELLDVLAAVMVTLGLLDMLFAIVGNRLLLISGQHAVFELRRDLFAHLQRLSLGYHRRRRSGELSSRLNGDIQALQNLVATVGTGVFAHLLTLIGMIVIMFFIDWRYALIVLSAGPILLWLMQRYSKRLRLALRQARNREGELSGLIQEIMTALPIVQAYGRQAHEDDRFGRQAGHSLEATIEASDLQNRFAPLVAGGIAMTTALATWYGATQVLSGRITAGELLVFLAYLRGMAAPLRQFAKSAGVISKGQVAAERLGDIFEEAPEIHSRPGALRPPRSHGAIVLQGVSFAYRENRPILHDINLDITPGQTVALVGATGAGKSTLAALVPRLHDPSAGRVLLDGHDLRELDLDYLRDQVALVLQEPLLLQGSVWENIAYGRDGAGRADAIEAACAVGIDDMIALLPHGYDTAVGERGAGLSGGQRQCVSIARAMLRDAPVVLLDEPTSALDAFAERRVTAALHRLTRGRTTLIIAHRLATIAKSDVIVVLDGGRIVETGQHEALLRRNGAYAALWRDDTLARGDTIMTTDNNRGSVPA
ncbi:ABC transporter permease [Acidihalobacter yilgarnensis]|uniref:ABC transporter permease n=1 Tax=Acidihalobacter yilgarnensis TaxID=2819280 RepID=A0A1D8IMJ3_9GAMM|nr:ABC transporter ATP-binding protein [Acidihalobacter yilgarnensis]AOU97692.1 ABC transporter permease [Acidihalobacter yilgarnensis]